MQESNKRVRFYVASKIYHYPKWLEMRSFGYKIISSWIDMVEEEETRSHKEWGEVSQMCLQEAAEADVLLLYAEEGDVMRGCWMEVGAALVAGKRVGVVAHDSVQMSEIFLPHPKVSSFDTIEDAFNYYDVCLNLDNEEEAEMEERVRVLPAVYPRIETGAVRFGDDWPGLFMRGDAAFYFSRQMKFVLERFDLEKKELPDVLIKEALSFVIDIIDRDVFLHKKDGE